MNKSDLVAALSKETALTKQVAEEVIDTVFEAMSQALVSGEGIEIRGLGSFVVKDYKPYTGRNPKTGRNIDVSAKKLPFFKAGKELKERVNSKKP
ncbi:MAG: HU family DNA-binding protein [Thermodesulfobacteriota bacterium]|nr:integration host factor subunit beta [Desulfovibrionales bacterium]MDQ7838973.1 HU family DNA-binding protein [Thermodesulfobacteriota bacterium]